MSNESRLIPLTLERLFINSQLPLKHSTWNKVLLAVLGSSSVYYAIRSSFKEKSSKKVSDSTKSDKVGVNKQFYNQISYILKICIPSWRSKTFGILVLHTCFLILRTYLSVVVARLDGRLVRDMVFTIYK